MPRGSRAQSDAACTSMWELWELSLLPRAMATMFLAPNPRRYRTPRFGLLDWHNFVGFSGSRE